MASTYLSDDCIYIILKFFQNSHSTLFNCLLVNRFWCKATVPLLYANPFDHTTNKNIILTLILCFNKVEILQLNNQLKLIHNDNIININDKYKSLFEYPKYLENFDYDKINTIIFQWLGFPNLSYNQLNKVYENFIPKFHQSILRRTINIKQLNISPYLFYEVYKNCNIQTFTSNLKKLNSLTLHFDERNNEILPEFLNNISNICLHLCKLEILFRYYYTYTNNIIKENLYKIIQKQNNLKRFRISFCNNNLLNSILSSLEFQKHSLIYIEFNRIDFNDVSFNNFINLYNLKYLKFNDCKGLSLNQCDILNSASFKLKTLTFKCNKWNMNITPLIIKYFGESLKELIIGDEQNFIIENIETYCSTLVTLEINVNLIYFDPSILLNLKIRTLNLNFNTNVYSNLRSNYIKLARAIPVSVKEISICVLYPNTSHYFFICEFLENCHEYLEIINTCCFIQMEFLKTILSYTERNNNNLKFLSIMGRMLNDEESKLLDQIKAKGIKVVDFGDSSFVI